VIRIDSEDDQRLAEFQYVGDPELMTRHGLFVAEGRLVVRRLIEHGRLQTHAVLVTPAALESIRDLLDSRPALPVYVVSQDVMNTVTGFNFHRGCLALGVRPPARHWSSLLDARRAEALASASGALRLVVLERIGNADNVGSIFRSAAAFGVDGVLLQMECADPLYRKAIRTSMAASLSLPYAWVEAWPGALVDLAKLGWMTVAMTLSPEAGALRDLAGTPNDRKVAVVLGHEGEGLTPAAIAACTHQARIPMAAGIDSLNVATAAAIALYELGRTG
jgi:tRNA G18 (ribose-2'-O)-methylase SpoU